MDFVHYTRDVEIFSPWKKLLNIRAICIERKPRNKAVVYIVQDATTLKQKQEETFNQKKLGAVLTLGAGFAHELGNPLNALHIHLQIMKRMLKKEKLTKKEISTLKKEIGVIESEINRMDHVIANFLKATRPEKVHFKEIEIIETVKLSLESLSQIAKKSNIDLEFKTNIGKKFLFADTQKIQQALINIIRNAIEAIKENGHIVVSCKEESGFIIIRVTDNGPGISEDQISRIFDPFFTTKDTGVGLGLAISYRIIKEHDGDISVKSSPGEGTTFQIKLPLREYKLKFLESKKD
jgi:signal transduction histidine kinase